MTKGYFGDTSFSINSGRHHFTEMPIVNVEYEMELDFEKWGIKRPTAANISRLSRSRHSDVRSSEIVVACKCNSSSQIKNVSSLEGPLSI